MRINNKKYKEYKKQYDVRRFRHELKRKKKKNKSQNNQTKAPERICNLPAPSDFSLINNTEECTQYFNNAIDIINQYSDNPITDTVQFEISKIDNMTIDALMYQLAIMTNLRYKNRDIKILRGTVPQKKEIYQMFIESGFLSYVKYQEIVKIDKSTSTTKILTGTVVDVDCLATIIDFVNQYYGTTKKETKYLYTFLSELMTNTRDHAYDEEDQNLMNKWYIYADIENDNNTICVTFLDTGYGLPNTIKKKSIEKIVDMINKGKNDCDYIISALEGEFRTETKQKHRGEGMPLIYDCAVNKKIKNLTIISSHAMVKVSNNPKQYKTKVIKNQLQGTLYYFEIDISCIIGGDKK